MAELKTQKNLANVEEFLSSVDHETRRKDSFEVLKLMRRLSGDEGSMWGTSIVGFGEHSYSTTTKKDNAWFQVGFSPRKASLTLYIMDGFEEYDGILSRLGKHKTGKSCLYINKLADVDLKVLEELIQSSLNRINRQR